MFNNAGINKVFLIGYIDKTPRLHSQPNGQKFYSFQLITNEIIKKDGQSLPHFEFHQIKIASASHLPAAAQLEKGQLIYLEGKIKTRAFVDENGTKRYHAEIVALCFKALSVKTSSVASRAL